MKTRFKAVLHLLVLGLFGICTQPSLHGQAKDITGTWQGTFDAGSGHTLRTVVKISKDDSGALKASFYSIDQRSPAIPITKLSVDGSAVKMSIVALGGSYEGKLTPDGGEMDGSWTQGGSPQPLILKRVNAADALGHS